MVVRQLLTLDDIVEVCTHQVSHQIPVNKTHRDSSTPLKTFMASEFQTKFGLKNVERFGFY